MAVKEITMYYVQCDRCGKSSCDDSEYAGWSDKECAIDVAHDEADFRELNGRDLCGNCWAWSDDDETIIELGEDGKSA